MRSISGEQKYLTRHKKRYERTISFLKEVDLTEKKVLDLGPPNPIGALIQEIGYEVTNTEIDQDLDLDYEIVKDPSFQVVTAFEILEHLVSPFPLLRSIAAKKLVISVPLSLWFASAYWSHTDPYDRHFHEFEPKQIKMLLEKAGWFVVKERKYTSYDFKLGIRPILRMFTPRHYFLYCERR